MGNLAFHGCGPILREAGVEYEHYPPWIVVLMTLGVDLVCTPLQCTDTWRNALPSSWTWFSREFSAMDTADHYTPFLSFKAFRAANGLSNYDQGGFFGGIQSNTSKWGRLLCQYLFKTPSTDLANLLQPLTLGLVISIVLLIRSVKAEFMPRWQKIGRDWAVRTHGPQWLQEKENQERINKFGEYVYRLYYHTTISLVGVFYFWNAPWWNDDQGGTKTLWVGPDAPVMPGMCWYYMFQAAYNLDALISLLELSFTIKFFSKKYKSPITWDWSPTVRGDFNEMLVHHLVTNVLIFASSYHRQTRVGSMVFWMHDISDIPVDLTKLANFVKWKISTVICFFLTMISWGVCRLYIFPKIIWGSIYWESVDMVIHNHMPFHVYYLIFPLFLILLGMLICLHAVWYSMFIKIFYVLATKGETHDLTVHKNGEQSPDGKPRRSMKDPTSNTTAIGSQNGREKEL